MTECSLDRVTKARRPDAVMGRGSLQRGAVRIVIALLMAIGIAGGMGDGAQATAPVQTDASTGTHHGLLAALPGVLSIANYQDQAGTNVLHAATRDGTIHEYSWNNGPTHHGILAALPGVLSIAN